MASTETLSWQCVIETLAELKQPDTSILQGLISTLPDFWTDVSEVVREKVALKYLEECLDSDLANAPSTSGSRAQIDVTRSSEEVLCSHLRKVAMLGSVEKGGTELSSHDLHQFIFLKRSALPKSSLAVLKESILEGCCPVDSSLMESSDLYRYSKLDCLQHNNDGGHEHAKSVVPEEPSDSGDSDDVSSNFDPNEEMFTIEKQRLLISQLRANQDSVAGNGSEQNLCIKCDKGGQLLRCSVRGCLIAVHESCLGPSVNSKETTLFYCPFCLYFKAVKNANQARKALLAFIAKDSVQGHRKKVPPASIPGEISQAGANVNMDHQHHLNDAANTVNNGQLSCGDKVTPPIHENVDREGEGGDDCESNGVAEHQHLAQPLATTDNRNLSDEEVDAHQITYHDVSRTEQKDESGIVNNYLQEENAKNQEHIRASPDHDTHLETLASHPIKRSAKRRRYGAAVGKVHHPQETVKKLKREKASSGSKRVVLKNQEQRRAASDHEINQRALNSSPSKRPAKRARAAAALDKVHHPKETVENLKRGKFSFGSSRRHAAQPKHYFNKGVRLGRREKLYWSSEEEETLKKAMQKFAVDSDGNYPWTKILEFGRNVFDKTRQPGDLKDKWRNIKKKEGKQEMS